MLKKCLTLILCTLMLMGCQHKEAGNVVSVAIIDGPATATWEAAKKTALEKFGLIIKLVKFSDYTLPNEAVNSGEVDANAFQHVPFLDSQIKARGYQLIPVANTFLYPIALYSHKIQRLSQLKSGDKIAIPNDPSNEGRALLLLQQARIIQLRKGSTLTATPLDIVNNPKKLQFIALDAAQLPRALHDVVAAVINNDYAEPAGLTRKDSLYREDRNSPYMNVIVTRPTLKNTKKIRELIESFQTEAVKQIAKKLSHGNAIAGW